MSWPVTDQRERTGLWEMFRAAQKFCATMNVTPFQDRPRDQQALEAMLAGTAIADAEFGSACGPNAAVQFEFGHVTVYVDATSDAFFHCLVKSTSKASGRSNPVVVVSNGTPIPLNVFRIFAALPDVQPHAADRTRPDLVAAIA